MNRIVSAGFIVRMRDGRYFLGKADSHTEPCWTIFKGKQDDGESLIDTAIRELKEESGIDVCADDRLNKNISTVPIFKFSMRDKDVYVFSLYDEEGVLDNFVPFCDSYYGVGSNKRPEIAAYGKFTLDEVAQKIFPSQLGLVEFLKKKESYI